MAINAARFSPNGNKFFALFCTSMALIEIERERERGYELIATAPAKDKQLLNTRIKWLQQIPGALPAH